MSTTSGYWERITSHRLKRRAVLAASGTAVGVASLSLIGCGSSSDRDATQDSSSLISKPVDTSAKAVKGGTYIETYGSDTAAFDVNANGADATAANFGYSRIVKYKAFKYPEPAASVPEGDAVSGWEVSPDGMQYTFKIRPNLKYDPRPPTNGRNMTSADVKFSWDRFVRVGSFANQLANSLAPSSPILGIDTPDANTFVMKLAFPYYPVLVMIGYTRYLPIMPVEADGKFDLRKDIRGTGAWRLKEFLPSQRTEYIKNPDWYNVDKVNFDAVTRILISEYASGLAQLKAGNIATYGANAKDLIPTKKSSPSLLLMAADDFSRSGTFIKFSHLPNSPFLDERVRRAISMLIDRDLVIDTVNNVTGLKNQGLPIETRWHSALPPGEEAWLDPKGKEIGEGGKNYQFNPAEAKKLLRASGVKLPIQQPFQVSNNDTSVGRREEEIVMNMLNEQGDFQLTLKVLDYRTEYRPQITYGALTHEGIGMRGAGSSDPDVDLWLESWFRGGADLSAWPKDPTMDAMIDKQKREPDTQKRIGILKDIQRHAATTMHMLWNPGAASDFTLQAPWVGNAGVWRTKGGGSAANETLPYLWFDASKKT